MWEPLMYSEALLDCQSRHIITETKPRDLAKKPVIPTSCTCDLILSVPTHSA